jgi:hypothetical protein
MFDDGAFVPVSDVHKNICSKIFVWRSLNEFNSAYHHIDYRYHNGRLCNDFYSAHSDYCVFLLLYNPSSEKAGEAGSADER